MKWPFTWSRKVRQVEQAYQELETKLRRVQGGYDQGVRQGTQQAYFNCRDFFIAETETSATPQERAWLTQWLWPRLDVIKSKGTAIKVEGEQFANTGRVEREEYTRDQLAMIPDLPEKLMAGPSAKLYTEDDGTERYGGALPPRRPVKDNPQA